VRSSVVGDLILTLVPVCVVNEYVGNGAESSWVWAKLGEERREGKSLDEGKMERKAGWEGSWLVNFVSWAACFVAFTRVGPVCSFLSANDVKGMHTRHREFFHLPRCFH
jgi:hypothetical protein